MRHGHLPNNAAQDRRAFIGTEINTGLSIDLLKDGTQDILGSPASYMVSYATEKFRADNPKTYGAFVAALDEVMAYINRDPKAAARDYLDAAKDPITVD